MGVSLKTPPTDEPLTLTETKEHLRVEDDLQDTVIATYIKSAREWAEGFTHRALMSQTWQLFLDDFPSRPEIIRLPFGKCTSVVSVKYKDSDGVEQTLVAGTDYQVDLNSDVHGIIAPEPDMSFPSVESGRLSPVTIEFVVGFGDMDDVPSDIRTALMYRIADMFEQRSAADQPLAINRNAQEHLSSGVAKTMLQPWVVREPW